MQKYIWQNVKFPKFEYNEERINILLKKIKYEQGLLRGKFLLLDSNEYQKIVAETYVQDVLRSSEIEGVRFSLERVRSSVAHQLGITKFNKGIFSVVMRKVLLPLFWMQCKTTQ